jgi:alkylhydroperoxidase family enzyme
MHQAEEERQARARRGGVAGARHRLCYGPLSSVEVVMRGWRRLVGGWGSPTRIAAGIVVSTVVAGSSFAEDLPDPRPLARPRIAPLAREQASDAQKQILGDGSRPTLNVTATVANHPELAQAWLGFARYVLSRNSLPARDREILILRIGWLCQSEYEWGQHSRLARSVGLTDEEIRRIADGPDAPGWSDHDRALLRAADELRRDAFISDATWAKLDETFSTEQLMDVVFTVGQYNLVSMALRTFGVQREEGVEGFPE